MAEVHVRSAPNELVPAITRGSVERLGVKLGAEAAAIINATEMMIAKWRGRAAFGAPR